MKALKLDPPRYRMEDPAHPFSGSLVYQGIQLDIEQAAGEYRTGIDPNGKPWKSCMPAHYGEVRDTIGPDGDAVDVFVGPDPFAPFVYVIQTKYPKDPAFDEHKAMLGFATRADAVACFREAYDKPGFYMGCSTWPIGSWSHAMIHRSDVQAGRMEKPLVKGGRLVVDVSAFRRLAC